MGTPDLPPAPPPPPLPADPTDEVIRNAKNNERRRALQMMGLARSFSPGTLTGVSQTTNKSLLGQ